ncbi:MAG: Ni/Fe hydrogenase subunit alpha [Gammaproteobacteria bacterium]|nr:MAG: Ni/Fe hydrogenase subunit alpha [Gammaproteobacteria bacterium]
MTKRGRSIRVPVLARVEGEGALEIDIAGNRITRLDLRIYEPPRLFEKFLEGRSYLEVPDMVARICGICPVAYQMSAVAAIEDAFGFTPGPELRAWRRLLYCGEWIESHALHIHLLAAPDVLGFESVLDMAQAWPEVVERGLRLQALGNRILAVLGGRSVHPVSVRPGGFSRLPGPEALDPLQEACRAALETARDLVAWTASLDLPRETQDFPCVALRHPHEYPMNEGRIAATTGLEIPVSEFEAHFEEYQVPHSTALHSRLAGRSYLVGPLARLNLNRDRLPPPVAEALAATGIAFPSHNSHFSIVARAVEIFLALSEAVRILDDPPPAAPALARPLQPRAAEGFGCTEAPRGILYHRYRFDADGRVQAARITPPTSQNQARMEEDARLALERFGLDRPDEELRRYAERVIRNYDPCISCATHFLRLKVNRR